MGDVLRTTPILTALKDKYKACEITWLVAENSAQVLEKNSLIDRLVRYSERNLLELRKRPFDLAMNFDKEDEALESIQEVSAKRKMGFGKSFDNKLCALDAASEYAYRLGIDDDLKFRKNQKTYQQITFEQAGLTFKGEEYIFALEKREIAYARSHLKTLGVLSGKENSPVVGLNTGSGNRFAGKKLSVASYANLANKFYREMKATVLLLGGQDEIERNKEIAKKSLCPVVNTGDHSIKRFAAIVNECDVVVSGDTIAMHVAIAMKVPVVAFFASTCAAEIELYGRGKKVVSTISCAPCYLKHCPIDEQCMKDIEPDVLLNAAKELLNEASVR